MPFEAGDAAVRGRDANVQIVEGHVPPRALGADRAAQGVGTSEAASPLGSGVG